MSSAGWPGFASASTFSRLRSRLKWKPADVDYDSAEPEAEHLTSAEDILLESRTLQEKSPVAFALHGRVELLSTEFAMGWASLSAGGTFAPVIATLDGEVIGSSVARLVRPDLERKRDEGNLNARAFLIVFSRAIPAEKVASVLVISSPDWRPLPHTRGVKIDQTAPMRLFLMGSPRSGTSELGSTLTQVLAIPWLGEGHAAPLFAAAADALAGDVEAPNGLVRLMAKQDYRAYVIELTKQAYFVMHASASFLDKTPGVPTISAAPFLFECFPEARFIFQRRNPVANVLSRLAKFDGSFEAHCRDWTAAMNEWLKDRPLLPHYLEVEQEEMQNSPEKVGAAIADYVGLPQHGASIARSLASNARERTGAGLGRSRLADTGWSPAQIGRFREICGPAAKAFSYDID